MPFPGPLVLWPLTAIVVFILVAKPVAGRSVSPPDLNFLGVGAVSFPSSCLSITSVLSGSVLSDSVTP